MKLMASPRLTEEASSWLYRITTNACINRLRTQRRYHAMQERRARENSQTTGAPLDRQYIVRRLLAGAEPVCASAAVYVYVEGLSHEEAAELLGVSRRTIGNLLDRFVEWAREQVPELIETNTRGSAPGEHPL